ncbi:HemK family protein methyltransferase [Patescibacteria group bacterium]|nr:HemK family protein methyltransferase [Patescibacteria group bacterium]
MSIPPVAAQDMALIRRDKYGNSARADLSKDEARLACGEPLSYVIGWVPFLNLKIRLDSHPLIPRPETEWWSEKLINYLEERFGSGETDKAFRLLDLCAGSGAIGLSILSYFPNAYVSFGELSHEHTDLIRMNIAENNLDVSRAVICAGDLFSPFTNERFDIIATNPPYIPDARELPQAVHAFEPPEALFSGPKGLDLIQRIILDVSHHLLSSGELWMECDISNIHEAQALLLASRADATIHEDLYGRPRLLVAHFT